MLEILNFKSHIELKLTETDNLVDKINNILQEGRLDKVSELAIDKNSLSKIIEGIILKHKILRPVFEGVEVARYFQLTSAHSWAEDDDKTIYSLIQIPIGNLRSTSARWEKWAKS